MVKSLLALTLCLPLSVQSVLGPVSITKMKTDTIVQQTNQPEYEERAPQEDEEFKEEESETTNLIGNSLSSEESSEKRDLDSERYKSEQALNAEQAGSDSETAKTQETETTDNPSIVHEGTIGTAQWTLDSNGLLTIGEGECEWNNSSWVYPPWVPYIESIKRIDSTAPFKISGDLTRFFGGYMLGIYTHFNSLESADLSGWDTSEVTNMSRMFENAQKLTDLNISSFDTSNVTDMSEMFYYCQSLTSLDIAHFDTSRVTNMDEMFRFCKLLPSLEVSDWNTANTKGMKEMFSGCNNLTRLDLSKWDTSAVTSMENMFSGCNNLTSVDVSGWDVTSVTSMKKMFCDCSSLTSLDVANWKTPSATSMQEMFSNCSALTSLAVANWDVSSVTSMAGMFYSCSALNSLDVANWNTSAVTDMEYMFDNCTSLSSLDASGWNVSSVVSTHRMFYTCSALTSLDVANWELSSVTDLSEMFSSWEYNRGLPLKSLDTSHWNPKSAINMEEMFKYCHELESIDVSKWDVSSVDTMASMFESCSSLQSLDVSNWNPCQLRRSDALFKNCSSLRELDLTSWNTPNLEIVGCEEYAITSYIYNGGMFENCTSLTDIQGIGEIDFSKVNAAGSMFSGCESLEKLDLSNWKTNSLTSMFEIFERCSSLRDLNLSGFDLTSIKHGGFYNMFYGCTSLQNLDMSNVLFPQIESLYKQKVVLPTSLVSVNLSGSDLSSLTSLENLFAGKDSLVEADLSGVNLSNVYNLNSLFRGCNSLKDISINGWDISSVESMKSMFKECSSLQTLDVSGWNTSSVSSMESMFEGCSSLQALEVGGWDTSSVGSMFHIFKDCSALQSLDMSGWDSTSAVSLSGMFKGCSSLRILNLSGWDTSSVTSMEEVFKDCSSLQTLNISDWDTSSVRTMLRMFEGCSSLQELDLANWDTSSLREVNFAFSGCSSLRKLSLNSWNLGKTFGYGDGYEMDGLFTGCTNLTELNLKGTVIEKNTTSLTLKDLNSLSKIQLHPSANKVFYLLPSVIYSKTWYLNGEGPYGRYDIYSLLLNNKDDLDVAQIIRTDHKEAVKEQLKFEGFKPSDHLLIPGKEPKVNYGVNYYEKNEIGTIDEEIEKMVLLMEQYPDAIANASDLNKDKYPSNKKDPIEKRLKKIDDASKQKMLTAPANAPSEAVDVAYSALADYLEMYKDKGVELKKINIKNGMISIEANIINEIRDNLKDVNFQRHYKNGYSVSVNITNFFGASFGKMDVTYRGRTYQFTVVSSPEDTQKALTSYVDALNGQVKDVTYQGLCEMSDYFWKVTGLGDLFKNSTVKFIENKVDLIQKYGFGDMLSFVQKLKDSDKILKSAKSVLNEKSPYIKQEKTRKLIEELDNLDYSDSSVRSKTVSSYLNKLTKAKDNVRKKLFDSIYGDDGTVKKPNTWIEELYSIFHCPVNIRVYDENGVLVGSIVDEAVTFDETKVIMDLNGDSKTVITPKDKAYRIEVEPYGSGEMSAYIEEVREGEPIGRVLYSDVPLEIGQSYDISFDEELAENELSLENAPALVNNVVNKTADQYLSVEDENANVMISGSTIGCGEVFGYNFYPVGNTVTLYAAPESGSRFDGWYLDGNLQSSKEVWVFAAEKDMELEARFVVDKDEVDTLYPYEMQGDYTGCLLKFRRRSNGAQSAVLKTASIESPKSMDFTLRYFNSQGNLIDTRSCHSKSLDGFSFEFPLAKINGAVKAEILNDNEEAVCTIQLADAKDFDLAAAEIKNLPLVMKYTGSAITPSFKVLLNGKLLSVGTDYTLSFENNTDPGTATIVITGQGNYTGSYETSFEITKSGQLPDALDQLLIVLIEKGEAIDDNSYQYHSADINEMDALLQRARAVLDNPNVEDRQNLCDLLHDRILSLRKRVWPSYLNEIEETKAN